MDLYDRLSDMMEATHGLPLPEALRTLYAVDEEPAIGEVGFHSIADMLGGVPRSRGMCPFFVPFAGDDAGTFGLVAPRIGAQGVYSVACWIDEYDTYLPVSSSVEAFLALAVDRAWYEQSEDLDAHAPAPPDHLVRWIAGRPGGATLTGHCAETEADLGRRALILDPFAPSRLCDVAYADHLAGHPRSGLERLTAMASRTPAFGDPRVVEGIIRSEQDQPAEAAMAFQCALASLVWFTTNSALYDLGPNRVEADLLQLSVELLLSLDPTWDDPILRDLVLSGDPYAVRNRLEASQEYEIRGAVAAAERECLNALALACTETETDAAYDRLSTFYLRQGCIREHDLVLGDAVRGD